MGQKDSLDEQAASVSVTTESAVQSMMLTVKSRRDASARLVGFIASLKGRIEELLTEVAAARNDAISLQSEIEELKRRNKELESDHIRLHGAFDEMMRSIGTGVSVAKPPVERRIEASLYSSRTAAKYGTTANLIPPLVQQFIDAPIGRASN